MKKLLIAVSALALLGSVASVDAVCRGGRCGFRRMAQRAAIHRHMNRHHRHHLPVCRNGHCRRLIQHHVIHHAPRHNHPIVRHINRNMAAGRCALMNHPRCHRAFHHAMRRHHQHRPVHHVIHHARCAGGRCRR